MKKKINTNGKRTIVFKLEIRWWDNKIESFSERWKIPVER